MVARRGRAIMRPMSCGGLRTKGMMTIFQIPFRHSGTGNQGANASGVATGLVWASVAGALGFLRVFPVVKLGFFFFHRPTRLHLDKFPLTFCARRNLPALWMWLLFCGATSRGGA